MSALGLKKISTRLYRPTSLRFRLTALVLAITVLVLLAATAFIGNRAATVIERNSHEQLNAASRTLAATVSVWLEAHLNALRNLVSLPDIVSMQTERQRPLLQKMAIAYPYLYLVCTTDLRGMNTARNDDESPKDYGDRTWFRLARHGEPLVFESLISRTNNKPSLVVSMPIRNKAGRTVGVGMFGTVLDKLAEQVQATRLGNTGYAYLIDENNRVLAHPDPAYTMELRDLSAYPPVAALRQGTRGQVSFSDEAGLRWRAYVTELENGWGVVVQQRDEEVLGTRRLFQRVAMAIIVTAVLLLMSATWWAARRALKPIEMLTEAVTGFASGMLSHPDFESVRLAAQNIRTRDEIGTLTESFSRMAVRLQGTLASLEQELIERKQAGEALKNSEKKIRELFEESKDVIFFSSPEGKYIDINPAGVELYGFSSKEELLTVDIARTIYVHSEERERFQTNLEQYGFVKDYELLLKRKDGEKLNALVTASAVRDESGRITAYRGIIRDVTNQRRLEAQLLQSQKMEAIGQLSGGIAHDFNNILTAVMGYASLLKSKTKQDTMLQSYVDQILTASTRAKALTQNLLAFSRKQTLHPSPVQVNKIITNIQRMLIQLIREDIEFKTILPDEDMTIMADSGQIEQLLINLVTNARDAMPHGGTLSIETTLVDMDSEFAKQHLFAKQGGTYTCISVTDTGTGMDEKIKGRIFEPFFTTKEMGKGTGLGLSIVYGIVKQHNGEINVYSEPGMGTTFRIYFPLIASKPEEARPQELPEPKGGIETLLLAEDDADVRGLTKTILSEAGYTVLEAVDGEDAIRVFSENKEAVQLVLLDVIMPKKNGKEVHNRIKKAKPDAKVLFMSGYSPDVIFRKGIIEAGLNLIAKPATPHELLRKVREIIDKKDEYAQAVVFAEVPKAGPEAASVASERVKKEAPVARVRHEGSIIVVDDDPHVLEYVSLLLEEQGYSTYACSNARDAVETLRDKQVDVILTDIVMPGMSGLELLETVHGIDPDMPVILVTAFADLGKAVESIKKGAYDFIVKPYDPEQLVRALDKAVRYQRLVRIEKEYKDKLEEFNKEMETLVAERSMNLMALTVADRVRNPATVIALACKKIMGKDIPGELKKYVSFIRDESDKLEAMVKSFHDLLGSRRSVFGYEDINEVVKNVISLIEKEGAAKGITLVLRLAEQPLKMNMQKNLMRVAVQHVLRNAIEATPAGGEVLVTSAAEHDTVVVTIADTGSGLPEQDIEKIFDPFYSTKVHRYGMGLPLIKQVVSEHMGEIDLKSEVGKGTSFRMVFPTLWHEK